MTEEGQAAVISIQREHRQCDCSTVSVPAITFKNRPTDKNAGTAQNVHFEVYWSHNIMNMDCRLSCPSPSLPRGGASCRHPCRRITIQCNLVIFVAWFFYPMTEFLLSKWWIDEYGHSSSSLCSCSVLWSGKGFKQPVVNTHVFNCIVLC